MNIAELAAHIDELCDKHEIEVYGHTRGGRAYKASRQIHIRPVKTHITYFIALHEIGHVVHPPAGNGLPRLEKEYHAWDWAIANALIDPSDVVMQRIRKYLSSYLAKARRSPRMKLPDTTHPFWDMVGERPR